MKWGTPLDSIKQKTAESLARRVLRDCADYDRTVCTGPGDIPYSRQQADLINMNARRVLGRALDEAATLGITYRDLLSALATAHNPPTK
jgi:hypothetical protein